MPLEGLTIIGESINDSVPSTKKLFDANDIPGILNLAKTQDDDSFELPMPPNGERKLVPGVVSALAQVVRYRCEKLGALEGTEATPVIDCMFSRDEPKTGTDGTLSWTVTNNNIFGYNNYGIYVWAGGSAAVTRPPGSTASSGRAAWTGSSPWKNHQGTPFIAARIRVRGPIIGRSDAAIDGSDVALTASTIKSCSPRTAGSSLTSIGQASDRPPDSSRRP